MYTVTFYSYKGGTGRSMALVNSAIELVKSGLKVLIVDFDLEAPGIDTFSLLKSRKKTKGIVDFVLEYSATGQSPNVEEFIYKTGITNVPGELWIMPAGKPDENYDSKFKSIDWRKLYEQDDGYILLEDLKAQWETSLAPDYVLIDSRTGHTDVSGICTRQLPDSVVLCFFPNEQNRRGLVTVVDQIRKEFESERKKKINLYFVMSNVPELDDEEGFLANNVEKIKKSLNFGEFTAVIHHYQSLALLNQSIFTIERPRTRLAREYQVLAKAIRKDNLDDRESAIEYLQELISNTRSRQVIAGELERTIAEIQRRHYENVDVLIKLAALHRRQRSFDEALALLEQAGKLGATGSEFYLMRAELYIIVKKEDAALDDVKELLKQDDATYLEILSVFRLLEQRAPDQLSLITKSKAFNDLDIIEKSYVLREFLESREALKVAIPELYKIVNDVDIKDSIKAFSKDTLILSLIGSGEYKDAIKLISRDGEKILNDFSISEAFNYSMAQWGLLSVPHIESFQKVIELDQKERVEDANGHLCLALALWALNNNEEAKQRLNKAWEVITKNPSDFSPWSYLQLSREPFLEDLLEIQSLIEGKTTQPRFIIENLQKKKK